MVILIVLIIIDPSLFCLVPKIFEKCVYARIINFLNEFNILSDSQYGFRSKHSTTHAVLHFLDKVSNAGDIP